MSERAKTTFVQHNTRCVEYKKTGWKLDDDSRHLIKKVASALGHIIGIDEMLIVEYMGAD